MLHRKHTILDFRVILLFFETNSDQIRKFTLYLCHNRAGSIFNKLSFFRNVLRFMPKRRAASN